MTERGRGHGSGPGLHPKTVSQETHPESDRGGLQEPIPEGESTSQTPVNSPLTCSHSDVNEKEFLARVWLTVRSRETIKSAGQPAGQGAVKDCVNSSAPFHFCPQNWPAALEICSKQHSGKLPCDCSQPKHVNGLHGSFCRCC